MAVTHDVAMRNVLADVVDDRINTGSGAAKVRLRASTTTIVDFDLPNPAFGSASGGAIVLNGIPIDATAAAAGVVDNAQILDRNGAAVITCSVTGVGGGGDIVVTNVNITSGQACSLDSLTYAAPA